MYFIRDAEGDERGFHDYATLDDALRGFADNVSYSAERYPQEFPFSIINRETKKVCLRVSLPE